MTENLIKEAFNYDIIKEELENKEINIFTNKALDKIALIALINDLIVAFLQ